MPALAFALKYLDAVGWATWFNIPWALVTPTTSNVAEWLVYLALALAVVFVYGWLLYLPVTNEVAGFLSNPYLRQLFWLALFLIAVHSLVRPPRSIFWLVLIVSTGVSTVVLFGRQAFGLFGFAIDRLIRWLRRASDSAPGTSRNWRDFVVAAGEHLGGFELLFLVLFFSVFSYMRGYYSAAHAEWFWVRESSNDAVILFYREQLVTVEFEPNTRVVRGNLKVIRTEGERLIWKQIGPLKVQSGSSRPTKAAGS